MKLVIIFCFFLLSLIVGNLCLFKNRIRSNTIILAIPLFYIAFNISLTNSTYRIVGEDLSYYINTSVVLLLVLVIYMFNKNTIRLDKYYIFFVIILLNSIIHSIILSDILDGPTFTRLSLVYLSIFLCYLIANSIEYLSINSFLYSFNILAILNGILGVLQIITKKKLLIGEFNSSILYTQGIVDTNRVVGIAGSNNSAGNLAVILTIICLYNFFRKKDLLSLVAVLLTIIFVLLTQTRIALLAIGVSGVLYYFLLKPKNKKEQLVKYILALFGIAIIIVSFIILKEDIIRIFFSNRGDTAGERSNQLERAWLYAMKDHLLFGIGSGQWRSFLYNNYKIVDIPIHSQYLNTWVENGLLSFILFIWMNLSILISTIRNKTIPYEIKIFIISFFIGNFIAINFNPNQLYQLNNVLYYLVVFIIYKSKKDWYEIEF